MRKILVIYLKEIFRSAVDRGSLGCARSIRWNSSIQNLNAVGRYCDWFEWFSPPFWSKTRKKYIKDNFRVKHNYVTLCRFFLNTSLILNKYIGKKKIFSINFSLSNSVKKNASFKFPPFIVLQKKINPSRIGWDLY